MAKAKKKKHLQKSLLKASNNPKQLFNQINIELDRKQNMPLPYSDNYSKLATEFNDHFVEKVKNIRSSMDIDAEPCYTEYQGS